jgi:putative RecB family exonuclease
MTSSSLVVPPGKDPADALTSGTAPLSGESYAISPSTVLFFGKCHRAFFFRKVLRLKEPPDPTLGLGRCAHKGSEVALLEHVRAEAVGPVALEPALRAYNEAWFAEGMSDPALYADGRQMVEDYVRDQGVLDHRDVAAVEMPFEITIGRHRLRGIIDRVDVVDRYTVRVIDLKSNMRLHTADELRDHTQMLLYGHAAKVLWPWAKNVELRLWMLRHRVQQEVPADPHRIRGAVALAEATADQILREKDFAPTVGSHCAYCSYRQQCSAYAEALAGDTIPDQASADDVEKLTRERESLVSVGSIVEKRKKQIDRLLMQRLKTQRSILTPSIEYTTYNSKSLEYPVDETVAELAKVTGWTREQVMARITTVDSGALKDVLQEIGQSKGTAQASLVEANLHALAKVTQTPRLWAKRLPR